MYICATRKKMSLCNFLRGINECGEFYPNWRTLLTIKKTHKVQQAQNEYNRRNGLPVAVSSTGPGGPTEEAEINKKLAKLVVEICDDMRQSRQYFNFYK